jgi:hypothetical protein
MPRELWLSEGGAYPIKEVRDPFSCLGVAKSDEVWAADTWMICDRKDHRSMAPTYFNIFAVGLGSMWTTSYCRKNWCFWCGVLELALIEKSTMISAVDQWPSNPFCYHNMDRPIRCGVWMPLKRIEWIAYFRARQSTSSLKLGMMQCWHEITCERRWESQSWESNFVNQITLNIDQSMHFGADSCLALITMRKERHDHIKIYMDSENESPTISIGVALSCGRTRCHSSSAMRASKSCVYSNSYSVRMNG